MNAIDVIGVSKTFRSRGEIVKVLDNVSLRVKKGEIFGLLGPNGAGKTTLLNIMTGMLFQDAGEIKIFGQKLDRRAFEKMNYVSGDSRFHWVLNPRNILNFYGMLYGVKKDERENRIEYLLEFFDLDRVVKRQFSDLSTGERMRLVFAKALMNEPKIMLLDEPTLGLDPDMAVKLRKEMRRINKIFRTTILLTSHYMQEVEQLAGRIAFMYGGRVIDTGSVKKVKMTETSCSVEIKSGRIKNTKRLERLGFSVRGSTICKELESDDDLNELLLVLSGLGVRIKNIEVKKPSLEDYFIKIVGESRKA